MRKLIKFILGSSLFIVSTFCFGDDNYHYENNPYIIYNDWSDTPWGRNNSSGYRSRSRNNSPWSGGMMPWGTDNPFWDAGTSAWRDWDTNKWGGNGMPWGGEGKYRKYKDIKKKRAYSRFYGRPYGGGYGYPPASGPVPAR